MDEPMAPDENAKFADLALPWLDHVSRFARQLARNPTDAEDLVQDTFLRALRGWHTFVPGTDCRRWLFTICRNAFLQGLRRPEPVACDDADLEALAAAAVHSGAVQAGYADLFSRLDLRDAFDRALEDLPVPFRETVVVVDLEDMAYGEASKVLGVPVGTVRSRLFRGRRLLQQALITYAQDAGLIGPGASPATGVSDQ